jgi:hypothetical protein
MIVSTPSEGDCFGMDELQWVENYQMPRNDVLRRNDVHRRNDD